MWLRWLGKVLLALLLGVGLALGAYFTTPLWLPLLIGSSKGGQEGTPADDGANTDKVVLTDAAIASFGLIAEPVRPTSFWRTLQVPGTVLDRPGRSDRGVVAPVTSVVTAILRVPGETVSPGTPLFTLTLLNDSLQVTQADLFKTTQELKLAEAQRKRVAEASSLLPASRLIEADNQLTRLQVTAQTLRTELQTRGLSPTQIDQATTGKFVREMTVIVPARPGDARGITYEVQDLKVELGQKVEAGQTLALLADHYSLAVEGRAFRDELARIEWAAKQNWPITVDLGEGFAGDREAIALVAGLLGEFASTPTLPPWSRLVTALREDVFPPPQQFVIRQIGNVIDPTSRTVGFQVPLVNQGRTIAQPDSMRTAWRYRPGQTARLHVPVERVDGVFLVPVDAVMRRGAETFVFTQNTNTFTRVSVRVLFQERGQVVLASGGELTSGVYVVQGSAGHLARMLDTQGTSVPKGYHMHADGSLHKNGDPEP